MQPQAPHGACGLWPVPARRAPHICRYVGSISLPLVQARRNGWELRCWEGNTRAPIHRETYRVTAVRPDGGLTVAPIVARGEAGEELGEPLQLAAHYVAADVTLGYASTVHAAEGRTVDTGHSVFGSRTDLAGLLVPITRGRESNTAWAITTPLENDAEAGETFDVRARIASPTLCRTPARSCRPSPSRSEPRSRLARR